MHLGRNIRQPHDGEKMFGAREESVMQLNCSSRLENQIIEHHHGGKYRRLFPNSQNAKISHLAGSQYGQS